MKRLQAIRSSTDWRMQVAAASDDWPGTRFDRLFRAVQQAKALEIENRYPGLIEKLFAFIGQEIAAFIGAGDSQSLHDLATALNAWKRHKPHPDRVRRALLLEAGPGRETSVRNVVARLRRNGFSTDENTPRIIRRMAKELDVRLNAQVSGTKSR